MAIVKQIDGDVVVRGTLSISDGITMPAGSVRNVDIQASAGIAASKLTRHQSIDQQIYDSTSTVADKKMFAHITRKSGTIVQFEAAVETVASSTTRLLYIDLQKATAATTWVTVLTAPININSSDVAYTPYAATISNSSAADGDIYRTVVTTTGASGNAAIGLYATLTMEEQYT